jgi:hypothetical protein
MRGDKLNAIVWGDDPFWGHIRHRWKGDGRNVDAGHKRECFCGRWFLEKPGQIKRFCPECEDKHRSVPLGKMAEGMTK